ncbi:MAG: hypothetical protein M1838_002156 [Thelocarpon superellum]|nr:MAG: hypothetical protein M1838_002156 [Thelocarpon superellum]
MREAVSLSEKSPERPTNFRVGALLFDVDANRILATGFTLELPGNTHAEQCCLSKYAAANDMTEDRVGDILPPHTVLFSTMEPCAKRLSGNISCVERILQTTRGGAGIRQVYIGVKEPSTFVGDSAGRAQLVREGVECFYVPGFDDEILKIATSGHGHGHGQPEPSHA